MRALLHACRFQFQASVSDTKFNALSARTHDLVNQAKACCHPWQLTKVELSTILCKHAAAYKNFTLEDKEKYKTLAEEEQSKAAQESQEILIASLAEMRLEEDRRHALLQSEGVTQAVTNCRYNPQQLTALLARVENLTGESETLYAIVKHLL